MTLNNKTIKLFKKKKKCIINADLDGILSGMILQEFLEWEVVGFSSCSGRSTDELWLYNIEEDLTECIFVDLPVCLKSHSAIDQHFISFDKNSIEYYKSHQNKINPNVIRERVLIKEDRTSDYTIKYPFGTVHFIIAALENIKIIDANYKFNFEKKLDGFDLADLILRADRVIGNTVYYTENCFEWMEWLRSFGGENTSVLFEKAKKELTVRKEKEVIVENKLQQLGCKGKDGDCSDLLRCKNYNSLKKYFDYLSIALDMKSIQVKEIADFGKLMGKRFNITDKNYRLLQKEVLKESIFSFAFVTMRTLSITYIEGDDNSEQGTIN